MGSEVESNTEALSGVKLFEEMTRLYLLAPYFARPHFYVLYKPANEIANFTLKSGQILTKLTVQLTTIFCCNFLLTFLFRWQRCNFGG